MRCYQGTIIDQLLEADTTLELTRTDVEVIDRWTNDPYVSLSKLERGTLRALLRALTAKNEGLVLLESPYAGNVDENVRYARACMRDSFLRGEKPFASHLLYTQMGVLDDTVPDERALGIEAGLRWGALAGKTVVYWDLGISSGMQRGVERAGQEGRPVEFRRLEGWER